MTLDSRPSHVPLTPEAWQTVGDSLDLTQKQLDVLRCIAAEMTDQAIERTLKIAHGTLRTRLARIFGKAGVRTRAGLIMRAMEPLLQPKHLATREPISLRPAESELQFPAQ